MAGATAANAPISQSDGRSSVRHCHASCALDSPTCQQVGETRSITLLHRYTVKVYKYTQAVKRNEFLNSITIHSLFFTLIPRLTDWFRTIFPAKKKNPLAHQLKSNIYLICNFSNHPSNTFNNQLHHQRCTPTHLRLIQIPSRSQKCIEMWLYVQCNVSKSIFQWILTKCKISSVSATNKSVPLIICFQVQQLTFKLNHEIASQC